MIVYANEKAGFQQDVVNGTIAKTIEDNVRRKVHQGISKSMFDSWINSLKNMYIVLDDQAIPSDAGIAIEYNIPTTGKRVDFIISGYDDVSQANMVIIELKQWQGLKPVQGQDGLVETWVGGCDRLVVHPSYQAWTYARLIYDFNQYVQDTPVGLFPCAYLHNYTPSPSGKEPLFASQYAPYLQDAPAFTGLDTTNLRAFICEHVRKGDRKTVLYQVENGKVKPSKSLQDCIAGMMKGNREFLMIDDQKVAYEQILKLSHASLQDGKKRTVIVKGGPGTGKTVIAINLLSTMTKEGQVVQYASKNSAPREVYLKKMQGALPARTRGIVSNLFKGSGSYTMTPTSALDTLLADEAHRLNDKSGMFHNNGVNQVKEIIHAAKCSVFFIDESQKVTLRDIGTIDEIVKWAKEEHSEVSEMELTSQFRCNGSDGYLAWLDDTLAIRETAHHDLSGIDYDFRVFDTPDEVFSLVKGKNKETNRSRMLAGYCWDWLKDGKSDPSIHDIVIGTFSKSWNLGNTKTWAIDPASVEQVGCVHTSQGLEFDYVGVIIGDDLRYENGKVVSDATKRAKSDQSLRGLGKIEPESKRSETADTIIKNTYRTLMTRGMKGCYVYCCNSALSSYLKERTTREAKDGII